MVERNLLVSFSGGETSAYMTSWILDNMRGDYDQIAVLFANTGQENEETLEFVHRCDVDLGFGTVWVEAVVRDGRGCATTHKIISYDVASRHGEPFEAVIQKYGIPNSKWPHCTRELKQRPIHDYVRDYLGWEVKSYDTAIGIRVDEIDRMRVDPHFSFVYPLATTHPRTKPQINAWWSRQAFRLGLKSYRGNCRACWKKSQRKLMTLMLQEPKSFAFFERMESFYGRVGAEFGKGVADDYRRVFFRANRSVDDLREEAIALGSDFMPADDDSHVFDFELDAEENCDDGLCDAD